MGCARFGSELRMAGMVEGGTGSEGLCVPPFECRAGIESWRPYKEGLWVGSLLDTSRRPRAGDLIFGANLDT